MWNDERIEDTVYRLMLDKKLDTHGFIDPVYPFDQAVEAYKLISEHPEKCVKLGFTFK